MELPNDDPDARKKKRFHYYNLVNTVGRDDDIPFSIVCSYRHLVSIQARSRPP
jgi:hypothetical protein